jgi:hypothetical protein
MKAVKLFFILFLIVYIAYLAVPTPDFPVQPPDALQSKEPADTETPLRRAYFTDLSRQEVLEHYQNQVQFLSFDGGFLTYRLNYPPEEAYGIIRDQTRSTFLEEIVHPFRESVYVNGFEPKNEKDTIFIEGKKWRQKITVRWVPSTVYARLSVGLLTLICIWFVYKGILRVIYITFLGAQESNKEVHP